MKQTIITNLKNRNIVEQIHVLSKEEIMLQYIKENITIKEACSLLNSKAGNFIKELIEFKKSIKSI